MSSIFKSGFDNIRTVGNGPLKLNVNELAEEKLRGKIIRPAAETPKKEEQKNPENEALLGDAMTKAEEILAEARARAKEITEGAEASAGDIFEDARRQGYEKGLEEGNSEAMKRADAYLERVEEEKSVFMADYDRECEERIASAEEKMVELSCALIQKMTGMLVDEYAPVMLYMINQSLSGQDASRHFTIMVPEESVTYLNDNIDRIVGATNPSVELEIYGDAKLERGSCRIESDNGMIDLSMDVQVNNLIKAFRLICNGQNPA